MPTVTVDTGGIGLVTVDTGLGTAVVTYVHPSTGVPTSAPSSFTLDSTGQLTNLTMNGRSWSFAAAPIGRFLLWNVISPFDPRAIPFGFDGLGTPTITQTASAFSIVWNAPDLGRATVSGAIVGDELQLACEVALQGLASGQFRIWALDFPYLRVNPYETATKSDMRLFLTQAGGATFIDPTQALSDAVYPYGYEVRHPEARPFPVDFLEPGRTPAAMKWMALYQRGKKAGLMLRTSQPFSQGQPLTGWNYDSDGDGTTYVWLRNYPPDNTATAGRYQLPHFVRLSPFAGEWYDACVKYRGKMESEAAHWLPAKLKDETTDRYPDAVKNAKCILYFNLAYGADRAASITKFLQQSLRAQAHFGSGIVAFLYSWRHGPGTENWPDVYVNEDAGSAAVVDLVADLDAAGITVIPYTFFERWSPLSQFAADNPTYSSYTVLDYFQNPLTEYLAQGQLGSAHYSVNYIHAQAQTWMLVQHEELNTTFNELLSGAYLDAVAGDARLDYRATLNAEDKGPGAQTFGIQKRVYLAALGAAIGQPLCSEFPDEYLLDRLIWTAPWNVGELQTALSHLPAWQTCFSEYTATMSFDTIYAMSNLVPAHLAGPAVQLDIWWLGRQWVNGTTLTLADILSRPMPWFVQAGEPTYTEWTTRHKPIMDWAKTATDRLDQALGPVQKYFRGRRLRPMVGSWDDYIDQRGFTPIYLDYLTALGAGATEKFPGTAIHSSVWQTDEEDGSPVGILLENFRVSEASVTISMPTEDYPETVGARKLLYENVAGVRTLVQTFFGPVSYTTTVPALSGKMFELVMQNDAPITGDSADAGDTTYYVMGFY